MNPRPQVVVSGGFDDLATQHLRFLEEAARFGELNVLLWSDERLRDLRGKPPNFPFAERLYLLNSLRHVTRVMPLAAPADVNTLPTLDGFQPRTWVDDESQANAARRAFCEREGLVYRVLPASQLLDFPTPPPRPSSPDRKKVVVTGCYDLLHSGHVRFFEEVSTYGELYVIVGHDANIRLLKGNGHPLLSDQERRYAVGSVKYVTQALISSGEGWLDADPEIQRLKPDIYAVNEDGDQGGKREYCAKLGLEYLVLQRAPAPGLHRRSSTALRGF